MSNCIHKNDKKDTDCRQCMCQDCQLKHKCKFFKRKTNKNCCVKKCKKSIEVESK